MILVKFIATVPQRLIREKYLKYSLNTFSRSSDLLLKKIIQYYEFSC